MEDSGSQFNMKNPSSITNKIKRAQLMHTYRKQKKDAKKEVRNTRKREREALGEDAPAKAIPRTLENTREVQDNYVDDNDEEIQNDQMQDEFQAIYSNDTTPKIMITTRPQPSADLYQFIQELMDLIPNSFYYKRGTYDIKDICRFAGNKKFTHLIVLSEKSKLCNGMLISRLPEGPTAFFKVSNVILSGSIRHHGRRTGHQAEVLLNSFTTSLGHRVGRFLGSLFAHVPDFNGRQAVTFHNQRDYIFVRQHRYVFDSQTKARLQELGPRFTMKLRWLQNGTFDTKYGEYEWIHKRKEMDTTRKRFHL